MKNAAKGFTLLEVLVAMAIFASVAAVVLGASARSLQNASRLEEKAMASWIAENRLTEMQFAKDPPQLGSDSRSLTYAGRDWQLYSETERTSVPALRRVSVWVAKPPVRSTFKAQAVLVLVGFIGVAQ